MDQDGGVPPSVPSALAVPAPAALDREGLLGQRPVPVLLHEVQLWGRSEQISTGEGLGLNPASPRFGCFRLGQFREREKLDVRSTDTKPRYRRDDTTDLFKRLRLVAFEPKRST